MKIGIVTLLDNKNYGNRWQNYAMNELMHSIGIQTENIYFWKRTAERNTIREKIKRCLPIKIAYLMHILSAYEINNFPMLKRVIKFTRYSNSFKNSKIILIDNYSEIKNQIDCKQYDFFAVGSDQVWNPYYVNDPLFFLTFAPKDKRLAFMASFGSDEIPEKVIARYTKWLNDMFYISVREPSAKNIVQCLTGKKADVFFDPTLLLDIRFWKKIVKKPKNIKLSDEYAVIFMFNSSCKDIEKLCKHKGMPLIVLNDKRYPEIFSLDPEEMLYMISHATMIFTDSFHIMALSIKFNRQFYIFNRKNFEYMFNRLLSTLNRLNIPQCIYKKEKMFQWNPISDKEYDAINSQLEEEREKFLAQVKKITKVDKCKNEASHEKY